MADLRLKTATFPHGQWDGLKDGRVKPEGIELEHVQASPNTYRRMVRNLEFDVAEVALTTFVAARWFGVPITGIPHLLEPGRNHEPHLLQRPVGH